MSAPPAFLSTTQIAEQARCSSRTILARAEQRGVKPIGMFGRIKLWTPDAAERLRRPGVPGRHRV